MCSWKVSDIVWGLVILLFTFWQVAYSKWIVAIAAAIIVIHALIKHPHVEDMNMPMQSSSRRSRRKKRR